MTIEINSMKIFLLLLSFLFFTGAFAQTKTASSNKTARLKIAAEMEYSVKNELLNKWYPQCIDSLYGGFITTYTYDFKPTGPQDKFIVTQARHTWTSAKAAALYPNVKYYLKASANGYHFLQIKVTPMRPRRHMETPLPFMLYQPITKHPEIQGRSTC
jgi:mannobiose 2-epimerase